MSCRRLAMSLAVVSLVIWAAMDALGADLSASYSAYEVVWARYGAHLAFMLLLWGWREPLSLVKANRPVFQIVRSLLMAVMPASFIMAVHRGVDVQTVMAVFGLTPLLVIGLAFSLLDERAGVSTLLAAGIAAAGALLTMPGLPSPHWLVIYPLVMATSFSVYIVMTRSLRTEKTRTNLFYTAFGVFVALSPLVARHWVTPNLHDVMVMTGIGLAGWLALGALDIMAASAPVSVVAPLFGLIVVFLDALNWLAVHRRETCATGLGLLLIVAAAVAVWRTDRSAPQRFAGDAE